MYIIDKVNNSIEAVAEQTFKELKFKEREHLQEWIAKNPLALGEDLLIIQKEFSGFDDTNERLDLLALDKSGNLVIIENKLDDSGKDVTWQALKYASYCSTLRKGQIIDIYSDYLTRNNSEKSAEEMLSEFFEKDEIEDISLNMGTNQRIILVAANFRKEVTSTVLWLMNYGIKLKCIKVTPYKTGEQLLLNLEQIIPIVDAEDYTIRMAEKTKEDVSSEDEIITRHHIRLEFWQKLLEKASEQNHFFANISPSKDSWIQKSLGISGLGVALCITKNSCRTEIFINIGTQKTNKNIYDKLKEQYYSETENTFNKELAWVRMDNKKSSSIKHEIKGVNYFEKKDWSKMIAFLLDSSVRMEDAFKERIAKVAGELKKSQN